jgi:hypothetical protein
MTIDFVQLPKETKTSLPVYKSKVWKPKNSVTQEICETKADL